MILMIRFKRWEVLSYVKLQRPYVAAKTYRYIGQVVWNKQDKDDDDS